jgi:hypothetical protein
MAFLYGAKVIIAKVVVVENFINFIFVRYLLDNF